jgi:hypothetical protein
MAIFTNTSEPIRTDFAVKLFPSGLALYTATYLHTESPFNALQQIRLGSDTGLNVPVSVWPMPEQQSSSVPGLKQYHVSAYGRWKNDVYVTKKIVTGTLWVGYRYETPADSPEPYIFVSVEKPIFYTQIFVRKVTTSTEDLPDANATIDFFENTGNSLMTYKPRFQFGNMTFSNLGEAETYAISQGGNANQVQNTGYHSLGKKPSDIFGGTWGANDRIVEPLQNNVNISINESDFGYYKEVEVVKGSTVNLGTIKANLIYDFGLINR